MSLFVSLFFFWWIIFQVNFIFFILFHLYFLRFIRGEREGEEGEEGEGKREKRRKRKVSVMGRSRYVGGYLRKDVGGLVDDIISYHAMPRYVERT